jgi:hypothetical protein
MIGFSFMELTLNNMTLQVRISYENVCTYLSIDFGKEKVKQMNSKPNRPTEKQTILDIQT